MKIGILLGPNARGGMERQANLLAQGLLARGISVRVIFNSRPSRSREGMDWTSIPQQYLWRYNPLKEVAQCYLGLLLKLHRINLLHVFYWGNMEFAVGVMRWARNVAFVGSQRDTDFVTHKDITERLKKACVSYDYLTCNSQVTRELMDYLDICPSNKVRVIYNGVVIPERTGPEVKPMKSCTERMILFPNRLFSYKNPIIFVEACAEVCRRLENIRIVVCGWGDLEEAMKERCKELGIMQYCDFLGSLLPEEIPYGKADVVVNCSSSREGMSNSLMEALAHGVPVVATKVAGNSELLSNANFGRLISINDKNALVTAMCDLLSISSEKRAALGKEAREYMVLNFSVERFVNEHIGFYRDVLSKHRTKVTKSA